MFILTKATCKGKSILFKISKGTAVLRSPATTGKEISWFLSNFTFLPVSAKDLDLPLSP
jgi:hypothetical protein